MSMKLLSSESKFVIRLGEGIRPRFRRIATILEPKLCPVDDVDLAVLDTNNYRDHAQGHDP